MRGIASMLGSRARTSASPPAIRSASTPPRPLGATSSGEGARRTPGSQRQNKSLTRELADPPKNWVETENESCTWDVKVAVKEALQLPLMATIAHEQTRHCDRT